jgi:hypothetical protein
MQFTFSNQVRVGCEMSSKDAGGREAFHVCTIVKRNYEETIETKYLVFTREISWRKTMKH